MKPRKAFKSEEANRLTIRRRKFVKSHQQTRTLGKNYIQDAKPQILDDQEVSTQTNPLAQQAHICAGCNQKIRDRYLLSACNKFWHDSCLKCDRCQAKLGELGSTLYEKGSMNLCRQDYFEIFGRKSICSVCDKLIYASEMVMHAKQNVYHLECFACQLCGLRFCVGDRFHLFENKIVCQYDYDEHLSPIQESLCQQHALSIDPHTPDNQSIVSHNHEGAIISGDSGTGEMADEDRNESERRDKNGPVTQEKKQPADPDSPSVAVESND